MILTVICDVLGRENNGTTIAAMNLIRSMRAKGHTVRVVCPDAFRKGEKDFYIVPTMNFGPLNGYLAKNGVTIAKPDEAVLREALSGADAVHFITPFGLSRKGIRLARNMGVPVTSGFHCQAENFTSHLFLMNARPVSRLFYKTVYKSFYRYVDRIHYPTEFIRNVFESEIGRKTDGRVISNGVNAAFFPAPREKPEALSGKFVILFTGRYSKEKSHSVLIDAANLSRHREKLQLIFAGCGPLEDKLKKRAEKLPNAPIFSFFSRAEMVKVLNYSDLYVHPAEVEIEAIACLEAISCGLVPVICDSPRSATRYFAQSAKNLFRCGDAADLAEKIDWWIEHPAERESCSRSYLGYSARFNFDHCMDEMERLIAENAEEANEVR